MKFERKNITITSAEDSLLYPVRTVARHEIRLYQYLNNNNIPSYLPVVANVKVHQVSYKEKTFRYEDNVLRPMLKSYVFAQLNDEQKRTIWRSNSVQMILDVTREQQPSFIEELRGLQMIEELALSSRVEYKKEIQVADRFCIEAPRQFEGVFGYLVERRKRFLWVIKLEIFGSYILAEIDPREYRFCKV